MIVLWELRKGRNHSSGSELLTTLVQHTPTIILGTHIQEACDLLLLVNQRVLQFPPPFISAFTFSRVTLNT